MRITALILLTLLVGCQQPEPIERKLQRSDLEDLQLQNTMLRAANKALRKELDSREERFQRVAAGSCGDR